MQNSTCGTEKQDTKGIESRAGEFKAQNHSYKSELIGISSQDLKEGNYRVRFSTYPMPAQSFYQYFINIIT